MEMQWPLILFTLFMAWSAGVFGTAAVLALAGGGKRVQMPALVTSVVLLAVGGIAVFFHLEHCASRNLWCPGGWRWPRSWCRWRLWW